MQISCGAPWKDVESRDDAKTLLVGKFPLGEASQAVTIPREASWEGRLVSNTRLPDDASTSVWRDGTRT